MSFGGYKFAGYSVDNSIYNYDGALSVCKYIHIARIRAFLDASNLAGRPWTIDPSWLNGELNCDNNYDGWDIHVTADSDGNVHSLKDYYGNPRGYATYFRYSKNELKGYYCIMTCSDYDIGDISKAGPYVLAFDPESCLRCTDEYDNGYYGPSGASCFHCLSLEPFGGNEQQTLNEGETYKYMLNNNQKATRITSIGLNVMTNYAIDNAGFAHEPNYKSLFGYCIKDTDIISICGGNYNVDSDYNNPFSLPDGNGTHVNIISLRGLSELYNKNDTYKFLQLDIKNGIGDDDTNEAHSSSKYLLGNANQVLNEYGEPMIGTSYTTNYKVYIPCDIRTFYDPGDVQSIPFSGLPIMLRNGNEGAIPSFTNSNQYFKGCTNPELAAMNFSSSKLNNDWYTKMADGSLLYLNSYSTPSDYDDSTFPIDVPVIQQNEMVSSWPWINGYFNFYIGWDASNPDIRDDQSWPEVSDVNSIYTFDPEDNGYSVEYMSSLFEFEGNKYYLKIDKVESSNNYHGDFSEVNCASISISIDNVGVTYDIDLGQSSDTGICGEYSYSGAYYVWGQFSIMDGVIIKFYNSDNTPVDGVITLYNKYNIGPITLNATYVRQQN